MTKMTEMHIEYLREMMNHKNKDWSEAAEQELSEIKAQFAEKGIFIV